MEDGGGGARGPCTAARNASSWSVSAAARSAASSASLRRRRFFSFFLRLRSRFRFLSFFFSFLRFRLRLRSSLLELELLLDDDELDDDDAICAHRFASSAWGTAAHCGTPRCDRCAALRTNAALAARCTLLGYVYAARQQQRCVVSMRWLAGSPRTISPRQLGRAGTHRQP